MVQFGLEWFSVVKDGLGYTLCTNPPIFFEATGNATALATVQVEWRFRAK
jgi:hypothetical protein